MGCAGECWDLGPPPDSILRMPPPPLPAFLQLAMRGSALTPNLTGAPCRPAGLCDPAGILPAPADKLFPGVEYVELPRHDSSSADDTWFLVLITSCVAVLFLGAMLALFLLKCREYVCSLPLENSGNKQGPLPADLAGPLQTKARPSAPTGTLYPQGPTPPDNRALWAALTPRGTQHFIADIYPQDCVSSDLYPEDNHYETVEAMNYKAAMHDKFPYPMQIGQFEKKIPDKSSFDNSGFVDYDYEDPAPLIESYQMDDMETCYQEPDINPYCIVNQLPLEALGTMKRGPSRPMVSSPTRIEHPNLPPLNLYPHRGGGTLRKPSHSRRVSDSNSYNGNINI